jgi:ketosteroid isomerase-like protein
MLDLIQTVHRAIEMGDHDVLETCLHPNVTYRRPGHRVLAGRDAVMAYYRRERTAATSRILLEEVVSQGDRAVVMGLVEGRGRDGAPIHERFADAYGFEDGLVRDRTTYFFRHGF